MSITIEQVPRWTVDRGIGHIVVSERGYIYTACREWGTFPPSQTERPRRICRRCRAAMKDLNPAKADANNERKARC